MNALAKWSPGVRAVLDTRHVKGPGILTQVTTLAAAAGIALLAGWVSAGPAAASCVSAPQDYVFQAPTVLQGAVIDSRPGFARVQVEEIWKGPATQPRIWVQTGQKPWSWPFNLIEGQAASSADITLIVGAHYVMATDDGYRTGNCDVLGANEAQRLGLRPGTVTQPAATGKPGASLPAGPGAFLAKAGILAAVVALILAGRRQIRRVTNQREQRLHEAATGRVVS
jgi:hypothetical protein